MSACASCQRRSWLLGALNGRLEYVGRSPTRLAALLELSDERLIEAVGGSESTQLLDRYEGLAPEHLAPSTGVRQVFNHDPGFP